MTGHAQSKLFILKIVAVLAYMTCLLQWFLVMLPFVPMVVDSDVIQTFVVEYNRGAMNTQPEAAVLPSWLALPLVVSITLGVIVATVVCLYRLPGSIGKTAQKTTSHAAKRIVPIVTHHQKIPEKRRRMLTARIIFDLKLTMLALPVLVILVAPASQALISRELIILVVAVLAGWALILFCLQLVLARAFRISLDRLW